ncbi:MAG: SHOCT domain-containing protein [Prolixibacteraceae bacterium]
MEYFFIIILLWTLPSFVIASVGKDRTIGYSATLILCLLFTPIIGLIIALCSSKKDDLLLKAKMMLNEGIITQSEYDRRKDEIYPSTSDKRNNILKNVVIMAITIIIVFGYLYFSNLY